MAEPQLVQVSFHPLPVGTGGQAHFPSQGAGLLENPTHPRHDILPFDQSQVVLPPPPLQGFPVQLFPDASLQIVIGIEVAVRTADHPLPLLQRKLRSVLPVQLHKGLV